jgi:hypothetical protein
MTHVHPLLIHMDRASHSNPLQSHTYSQWPVKHVHFFWQLIGLNKPLSAFTIQCTWPMSHVHPLWLLWVIIRNYKLLDTYKHYTWSMFTRCNHSWIEQTILIHYNLIQIPHDPWTMFIRSVNSQVLASHYQPLQWNAYDQWPMFTRSDSYELL